MPGVKAGNQPFVKRVKTLHDLPAFIGIPCQKEHPVQGAEKTLRVPLVQGITMYNGKNCGRAELRATGNSIGQRHRVRQRIAGGGMKQPGAQAAARLLIPRLPVSREIPRQHNRQMALLFANQALQVPALLAGIISDILPRGAQMQPGGVNVVGIFNQQFGCGNRQGIDKTIPALLIDRGVHQYRSGQAVGLAQTPLLAEE